MSNFPQAPLGPRLNGTIVTPGTLVYNPPLTALYIGGTGALVAVMENGGTVTLPAMPVGWVTEIAISNVTTATTCTNITGFW